MSIDEQQGQQGQQEQLSPIQWFVPRQRRAEDRPAPPAALPPPPAYVEDEAEAAPGPAAAPEAEAERAAARPEPEEPYNAEHTVQLRLPVERDVERTMMLRLFPRPAAAPAAEAVAVEEKKLPSWELPPLPDAGWSAGGSRRRRMISRGLLAGLLLVQALLSLRLKNTAFEDEALYIYAGHVEIGHLFFGAPNYGGFDGYFSGAPTLYPVLAAAVDSLGGLVAVRAMSLVFMLIVTACLYSISKRLFNERAALCGAALFAFSDPILFLGNFATYDALAVCLLAVSTWIVVTVAHRNWAMPLLAVPVAALAVGVKYASALFLPTIVLMLVLTAYQHHGVRGALARGFLFGSGVVGVLAGALYATDYLSAIESTTTARAHGDTGAGIILEDSGRWGGMVFAVAVVGALLYARRARLSEMPGWRGAVPGARWRLALGLVMCGTALLAPAYQIHLATETSLQKHVGFGLFFAAPMAGLGVTRLMGAHFTFPQWGIAIGVVALTLGMNQSASNYGAWPNTTYLTPQLSYTVRPNQHWLGDPEEGPIYYLSKEKITSYTDWLSFFYIDYTGRKGQSLTGIPGYRAAVEDGYFDGVVLNYSNGLPAAEQAVRDEMRETGRYRLQSALPYQTSTGAGHFEIWVRVGKPKVLTSK